MKENSKRVFISDLPETATQEEITKLFNSYGEVRSVEIKERKELGPKNTSLFFSYVNIDIDERALQQCFQEFANTEWHGECVKLQLARESFLERLKREREDASNKPTILMPPTTQTNGYSIKKPQLKVPTPSSSDEDSSSSESETEPPTQSTLNLPSPDLEELDIVIKNNRNKQFDSKNGGLKIESVGNRPIYDSTSLTTVKSKDPKRTEADLKRQQSLNDKIKGYHQQKLLVQTALSKVDKKSKNKIVFNEYEEPSSSASFDNTKGNEATVNTGNKSKKSLFEEDEAGDGDNDDFKANFEIKEQFQGKKGQKLMELQSRYKNDKRFALDERFLDEQEEEEENKHEQTDEDGQEVTIQEEKRQEYKILEEILGKKVTITKEKPDQQKKKMLRYDPTQENHAQYEVKASKDAPTKKKKRKRTDDDDFEEVAALKRAEIELEQPIVSKDVFYEVKDNFQMESQQQQNNEGFSLLSMFGKHEDDDDNNQSKQEKGEQSEEIITVNNKAAGRKERNPFKYDSSSDDDDDNNKNEPKEAANGGPESELKEPRRRTADDVILGGTTMRLWTEPFFFKDDDFRLQEGFDFMKRIATAEEKSEFVKIRKDVKNIVRAKVRNNLRKNKLFKKKLGGKKRRKNKRIEKAMNR